jgi:hypothetical protein
MRWVLLLLLIGQPAAWHDCSTPQRLSLAGGSCSLFSPRLAGGALISPQQRGWRRGVVAAARCLLRWWVVVYAGWASVGAPVAHCGGTGRVVRSTRQAGPYREHFDGGMAR